jgi:hypothetical protein
MTKNRISAAMLFGALFATTMSLSGQGQGAPTANSNVETVVTLPSNGRTENISQGPDGSFYITGLTDRILWKVTPKGQIERFFTMPSLTAFVGVATNKDEIVLGVFSRPFLHPTPGGSGLGTVDKSNAGSQILVLDKHGSLNATIGGQIGQFFNGIARAGDGWYLITDTNGTALLRLDIARKTIEPWLKDDLLAGQNGIKVHQGWVYVACGSKMYRIQIGSDGKPKSGVMLFAEGVSTDDFDIAPDGTIYISSGMTIMRISPTGEISKFLDNVPNGASSWVTKDGKWLYWSTRSGDPQVRLLRAAIP